MCKSMKEGVRKGYTKQPQPEHAETNEQEEEHAGGSHNGAAQHQREPIKSWLSLDGLGFVVSNYRE